LQISKLLNSKLWS